MITGSAVVAAVTVAKIAVALGVSTGITSGVKWFNTFEWKEKKKGGGANVGNDVDHLRERVRSKY